MKKIMVKLPDGRHFLYTLVSAEPASAGVYVGELGTTKRERLIDVISSCVYAAPGFLVYVRFATLYAQPFDAGALRLVGAPVPIAPAVAYNPRTGRVPVAVADTGAVAYRGPLITELVWVDRSGIRQSVAAPAGTYLSFSIAPDGRRVAAARLDPRVGTADIWMFGPGEHAIRVTDNPAWTRARCGHPMACTVVTRRAGRTDGGCTAGTCQRSHLRSCCSIRTRR